MRNSDDSLIEVLDWIDRILALDVTNPRMDDIDELLRILGYGRDVS